MISATAATSSTNVPAAIDAAVDALCQMYSTQYALLNTPQQQILHALIDHGITSMGLTFALQQEILVHHIMNGLCSGSTAGTCRLIAGDAKPRQLAYDISCRVQSAACTNKISLHNLRIILLGLGHVIAKSADEHKKMCDVLNDRLIYLADAPPTSLATLFMDPHGTAKSRYLDIAACHGISCAGTREEILETIVDHFRRASCVSTPSSSFPSCEALASETPGSGTDSDALQGYLFASVATHIRMKPLKMLLRQHGIEHDPHGHFSVLRRTLKAHARTLLKGKRVDGVSVLADPALANKLHKVRNSWPRKISDAVKDNISALFTQATNSEALEEATCASCAESCLKSEMNVVACSADNIEVFMKDVRDEDELGDTSPAISCVSQTLRIGANEYYLDQTGVIFTDDAPSGLRLCRGCEKEARLGHVPRLSLANRTILGDIPEVLKDLTAIEESMIALSRAKCWIVQLKERDTDVDLPFSQRALRGHVIVYPQNPDTVARVLPPSIEDIVTPICVIFIGSSPPTQEWIRKKARPLTVRADRVRAALVWLKANNPLYQDITINEPVLTALASGAELPIHVEHILPQKAQDVLQSRYDVFDDQPSEGETTNNDEIPFENVVIADVDGHASSNELRAAAMRHLKDHGGGYIEIPHDAHPVNEFKNKDLFPMMYPTLFPYGIGGVEDCSRTTKLSFEGHLQHMLKLADRRFQEHPSFIFTAFNMLQRRALLLHTSLKVKKRHFPALAESFAHITPETIQIIVDRVSQGDYTTSRNDEEKRVMDLMREVKAIAKNIPCSSASKAVMRNEIRAMMMSLGLPSFYVTINPADVYNPVVKFLAGEDIDVDALTDATRPQYMEQSLLVAKNPVVAAKFFNIYMKAFIKALLGFDPNRKDLEEGILGVVKGYYGCVEAQGRGTLHCHMLIWIEGGLNPNEIKQRVLSENEQEFKERLIQFLDDTMSNFVPPPNSNPDDPSTEGPRYHPCTYRRPLDLDQAKQCKDLRDLVKACQVHSHKDTCFKYWRGPPDPRECRFDLDPANYRELSTINTETGELELRCLDGLVNNYNTTILQNMRCNMDIKFIGSGPAAKAILYYITDYISKSQLKTHVAYAALELAVSRLGEYNPEEDEVSVRAKRMLQKCTHAMVSHQELSSQQVASHLMGFEDHFTSHHFRQLYWTSFEAHINREDRSPECYLREGEEPAEPSFNPDIVAPRTDSPHPQTDDGDELLDPDNDDVINPIVVEDTEDVLVDVNQDGDLVQKASHVQNYIHRGHSLEHLSLWDFCAQVDKVSGRLNKNAQSEEGTPGDREECPNNEELTIFEVLASESFKRPKDNFLEAHQDHGTHHHVMVAPSFRWIPVPIGPAIPRRDKKHCHPRYCRLMLMLFKPWRTCSDLRTTGQAWEEAFNTFAQQNEDTMVAQTIENMQLLHECKDSRDDHYANRRHRRSGMNISQELRGGDRIAIDDSVDEFFCDGDVLAHLDEISASHSVNDAHTQENIKDCLLHAQRNGVFGGRQTEESGPTTQYNGEEELSSSYDGCMENMWRQAYDQRRDDSKKRNSAPPGAQQVDTTNFASSIRSGDAFRSSQAHDDSEGSMEARIAQDHPALRPVMNVDVEAVASKWELNDEQRRAFRLVAMQSFGKPDDPLRMFLNGCAGTGKSRVINALRDFFEKKGEARRFRVCSYMGIAAKNVNGMTLHAALCFGRNHGTQRATRPSEDLQSMWEGVDFLFIDEVSMISCKFLADISEALSKAKGNAKAFGNINVVFAGDLAQLPPVAEKKLYARVDTGPGSSSTLGQKVIMGKLLWLGIKTVVTLTEQHRQSGDGNRAFVELLGRLREGKCTKRDFATLSDRVINKNNYNGADWDSAPIICYGNAQKDAMNEKACQHFARQTGQKLHYYYADDRHKGGVVEDEALIEKLGSLHSGKTKYRLGRLPLVIGMPVLVSQNFDVEGGVTNGSRGTVKRIRYSIQPDTKRRILKSCIVHIPDSSPVPLPNLTPHEMPIVADITTLSLVVPRTNRHCSIRRTQVPILPAFAMTAHRAQGQTMERVIVDLESCQGTEAPYVMVSRAKSLDGLLVLRPFKSTKIACALSQESRTEKKRLQILDLVCRIDVGDELVVKAAKAALAALGLEKTTNELASGDCDEWDKDSAAVRLHRLQSCDLPSGVRRIAHVVEAERAQRIRQRALEDEHGSVSIEGLTYHLGPPKKKRRIGKTGNVMKGKFC